MEGMTERTAERLCIEGEQNAKDKKLGMEAYLNSRRKTLWQW